FDNRRPTDEEIGQMRQSLGEAMAAGAFGMSTGLCYTPATYAQPDEVQALAAVVAAAGGIYSTHIRNEVDLTEESLVEAIAVAEATGVGLHISHLKVAGRAHFGTGPGLLAVLDAAVARGVDVTADVYPY